MSETKHTPGEWEVHPLLSGSENDRGWGIWGPDGRGGKTWIADVSPMIKSERGDASEEGKANAQLIAAAPELLEALTSCLRDLESWVHDQLDGTRMFDEVWQTMEPYRAAIAKAEGR